MEVVFSLFPRTIDCHLPIQAWGLLMTPIPPHLSIPILPSPLFLPHMKKVVPSSSSNAWLVTQLYTSTPLTIYEYHSLTISNHPLFPCPNMLQ
jgi:hypothetical protein